MELQPLPDVRPRRKVKLKRSVTFTGRPAGRLTRTFWIKRSPLNPIVPSAPIGRNQG